MLKQTTTNWYESSLFSQFPFLTHGFSTRQLGDARQEETRRTMLAKKGLGTTPLSRGKQVHGTTVQVVTSPNELLYADTDALITTDVMTPIGVVTADCVPILLLEPKKRIIGVVHGGWKGILNGILGNTVSEMEKLGAEPREIVASIGPHISACCYMVPNDRAVAFQTVYHDVSVAGRNEIGWFVDIGKAASLSLQEAGVLKPHIDSSVLCTSCQATQFYSYRKDSKETFGEMLSFAVLH